MKEYLMIGGPRDGRLITFPGDPPPSVIVPVPSENGRFGQVAYVRNTLRGRDKTFFVYVTGGGDLIERLLVGYGVGKDEALQL